MSPNLVELVRRHHEQGAPTALEVLKDALEHDGEITDDDRRLASERSGLPEAAVYGVSTFYDDLLVPRGRRHVPVCTGTARSALCWPGSQSACAKPASVAPAGCTQRGCSVPPASCCSAARTSGATTRSTRSSAGALQDGLLPLHERILCISGRLSFELVQKAAVGGAPVLVGVGAPTSLAVALADDRGMTLAGFARGGRVNIYSGDERVT